MDKLTIISNDRFYNHENDYFCDHIAEKTLADELDNKFEVTLIGRKTNIQHIHVHVLYTKNAKLRCKTKCETYRAC